MIAPVALCMTEALPHPRGGLQWLEAPPGLAAPLVGMFIAPQAMVVNAAVPRPSLAGMDEIDLFLNHAPHPLHTGAAARRIQ